MKEGIYIIYDPKTYQYIKSFNWCYEAERYAMEHGYKSINRTHAMYKPTVERILKTKKGD